MDRVLGFFDQPMLIEMAIQFANTFVLCGALAWLLYKPVKNFLQKRTERIQNQLAEAEENMRQSNELKLQYENKLREINKERDSILENARRLAQEKEEQIIKAAKQEADAIRSRALLDIRLEQERVKDEVKDQMIEISAAMAGRFVAASMDSAAQKRLLDEVISDLGDVKWLN